MAKMIRGKIAWRDEDIRTAKSMLGQGKAISQIAKSIRRTPSALRQKLFAEGISLRDARKGPRKPAAPRAAAKATAPRKAAAKKPTRTATAAKPRKPRVAKPAAAAATATE